MDASASRRRFGADGSRGGSGRSGRSRVEGSTNIAELAERVAAERGVDKKQAKGAIEAALKAVVGAARSGTEIRLTGFGKFRVQDRPEREGRDPATGEAVTIASSRKLAFTPDKAVEDPPTG